MQRLYLLNKMNAKKRSDTPFLKCLMLVKDHFSCIEKIVGIYYDTETNSLNSYSSNHIQEINLGNSFREIQQLRSVDKQPQWFGAADIFFERPNGTHANSGNDLFSELDKNILLLRVKSRGDYQNDLIYVFYNAGESRISQENLSTVEKSTVSRLLLASITSILDSESNTYERLNDFIERDEKIVETLNKKKDEIRFYEERQLAFANHILETIKSETGTFIFLTDEAQKKIREFKGGLHQIEPELRRAVALVKNTSPYPTNSVELQDYNIYLNHTEENNTVVVPVSKSVGKKSTSPEGQFKRTIDFLDRLEKAVNTTYNKNEKITGANVGANFSPPISAPAISDALKKHRKRIIQLMLNDYRSNWLMTRNHFRPIQNILEAERAAENK